MSVEQTRPELEPETYTLDGEEITGKLDVDATSRDTDFSEAASALNNHENYSTPIQVSQPYRKNLEKYDPERHLEIDGLFFEYREE